MKSLFIPTLIALLTCFTSQAQEYKISMSSGTLIIQEVNAVTIEGASGNEVIIVGAVKEKKEDERSAGLREINALGLSDNTKLGLHVSKDGNQATVRQISKNGGGRYTIKVPAGVAVSYEHSTYNAKKLIIRNTSSEIEVSANYNGVEIENASGPLAINSVYGPIDAVFNKVGKDVTLYSVYSRVDATVPANAKANFHLKTSYGQMFTDLDLDFGNSGGDMKQLNNQDMIGKLNGGGVDFKIKASYGKIYLRKG